MTIRLKTKIVRKHALKLKVLPKIPANFVGANGISIVKANGTYTATPDYSLLSELTTFDPTQELVLLYKRDGTWAIVPVSTLINNQVATTQIITSGATYAALANDKLIAVNKTSGSATTITLPLSSMKVGPVRIVDFKGDADTNNITVNASGSDKFNGNSTSWMIVGANASILLTPISGVGYAVS